MPNLALVRRSAQHARRLALLGVSMPPAMGPVVRLGPRRRRHVPNVPGVLVCRRLEGLVRPEDPDQGGDQDPAGDGDDGPERGLGGRDQGPALAPWLAGVFLYLHAFSAAPGAAFSGHGRVAALGRDRTRRLRVTASSCGAGAKKTRRSLCPPA